MAYVIGTNLRKKSNTTLFKSMQGFANKQQWKDQTTIVKTKEATTHFEWLGDLAGVKEWKDKRQIEALTKHSHSITAKSWEDTIGIDKNDLADNGEVITPRIKAMGYKLMQHLNKRFWTVLVAGTSGLGYDGVAFFSDSHPIDDSTSTNDNLMTGAGITEANIIADWLQVKKGFLGFNDREGDPLLDDLGSITIYHSSDTMAIMDTVFNKQHLASGETNVNYQAAKTVTVPYLSGNDWYAFKTDLPMKAMLLAERKAWKTEWDTTREFDTKKIYYGADARYDFGYGYWQLCIMVNN